MFKTKFCQNLLNKKKTEEKLLLLIIFLAFILRLYKINNSLLDWHAFRQADTASVTREFLKQGLNILKPRYHDLSNIQSGYENPQGWRMVEFPLISFTIALIIKIFPIIDLVIFSRLCSILASLITIIYLFYFVKKNFSLRAAFYSALVAATLPYVIFYSRVVLPEPFLICFLMAAIFHFDQFLATTKKMLFNHHFYLSLLFLALAFLHKPFVVFFIPVFLTLMIINHQLGFFKKSSFYFYVFLSIIPFIIWRLWIKQFTTGIPVSNWLFNSDGIRLRPDWFRWLFFERISKLMLGYIGLLPIIMSFTHIKKNKSSLIIASFCLSSLLYLIIIATGNVRHDYYQNLLIPGIIISFGVGCDFLTDKINRKYQKIAKKIDLGLLVNLVIIISSSFLAFYGLNLKKIDQLISENLSKSKLGIVSYLSKFQFSLEGIKGYYNINHWEYMRAGKMVDLLTNEDALVIAPAQGDTQFLFQTNRRGWPIGFNIKDKIEKGASIYVTTTDDNEARDLQNKYHTLYQNQEFLILYLLEEKQL